MTVVIDDPLIAGMSIGRTLPIHESSRRLRELYRECPRVYGVAVMGDLSRRRWWPLAEVLTSDRLQTMFDAGVAETESRAAVAQQLAATFAHVVVGRVIPFWSSRAAPGTPGWRTCGCTSIPRAPSTGSASSIRRFADCPMTRSSPTARRSASAGPPGRDRRASQRGGVDDVGRPP